MSVSDGQPVNAAVTNAGFLDKNIDTNAFGRITLANVLPESGASVANIQAVANSLLTTTGATQSTPGTNYSSQQRINNGDNHQKALGEIDSAFNGVSGHQHTGAVGDGPKIPAPSISGTSIFLRYLPGATFTGVTGGSIDVSSDLVIENAASSINQTGVPIFTPSNWCFVNQVSGVNDGGKFVDGTGNIVYGRVTKSGLVWTLTFYSDVSGVETAYSFNPGVNLEPWYPVFGSAIVGNLPYVPGEFSGVYGKYRDVATFGITGGTKRYGNISLTAGSNITITDNTDGSYTIAGTAGITYGTTTQDVAAASGAGVATSVSRSDHIHRGVHSISVPSGNLEFGDLSLVAGTNMTITDNGSGQFTFAASGTSTTTRSPTVTVLAAGTSGTYTLPANCKGISVEGVGGGAGGGGTSNSVAGSAGGGSAGGYFRKMISSPSGSYAYNIGSGGAGGSSGNNAGSPGGNTTFGSLFGSGGTGGIGSAGNSAPGSAGGTASGGDLNVQGGDSGGGAAQNNSGNGYGGDGGDSYFGGGGYGGQLNLFSPSTGKAFGSGGGGGGANGGAQAGASGMGGVAHVTEYY